MGFFNYEIPHHHLNTIGFFYLLKLPEKESHTPEEIR